ncbi:peptidase inhibitor family I36 protein [Nonomuraea sp. NPDC049421]|uniref:peptidase inhibitor family I36 protein n=1 Tax=Nonomuraea sp. NPDC049421 TaxID=3155275 RepID=UPI00342C1882
MKHKLMKATGAVLVSITCVMSLGTSAHAVDNLACAPNKFCLYEHDNFKSGYMVQFPITGQCWTQTGKFSNMASSMVNNTGKTAWLFDKPNCAGTRGYTAKPESEDKDFTNNGWDNKTSSVL